MKKYPRLEDEPLRVVACSASGCSLLALAAGNPEVGAELDLQRPVFVAPPCNAVVTGCGLIIVVC
eukprot:10418171-Ditylum_brightwellii.AAC.1